MLRQGAALRAISKLPDPPKQLSSLINRVLLSAEGYSYTLWEPCALALRAKVDRDLATEAVVLRTKSNSDEYRDRTRREEEATMLSQAQTLAHSPAVDAGGRTMIGLNGRVLAP